MIVPAILARGLSKRYQLGVISRQTLTDEISYWWHRVCGRDPQAHMGQVTHSGFSIERGIDAANAGTKFFWALKDVSFDIQPGEIVGVIGRNGAGKSTLLKILSRITEPSDGEAEINGRVGSLLEVGTGFHPELTGRENIYMNGAILGMKKAEIDRKFDEIVSFAEIEQFLDTPVKRYSSGMYVRLAFAVAAHLEPEILIVDEVLAVGDAQFQRKCLGKMSDVSREGRTVMFVSHNMAAVQGLTNRTIVLNEGKINYDGDTPGGIACYVKLAGEAKATNLRERPDRQGTGELRFTGITFHDAGGRPMERLISGQDALIRLHYEAFRTWKDGSVRVSFNIRNPYGQLLTNLNSHDTGDSSLAVPARGYFECRWSDLNLRAGDYDCNIHCAINGRVMDLVQSAFTLRIEDGDFHQTGKLASSNQGDILIRHRWRTGEE